MVRRKKERQPACTIGRLPDGKSQRLTVGLPKQMMHIAKMHATSQEANLITFSFRDSDTSSGSLHCEFCDGDFPIDDAHTWFDRKPGDPAIFPQPQLVVRSHFYFDENADMPECEVIFKWHTTEWQAVNLDTGEVQAKGRVLVSATKEVDVRTDWEASQ